MVRSKRFERLAKREVNKDIFVQEAPELGLILMDGPNDPAPSIEIRNGVIVEMDGRAVSEFDMIDRFIAKYAIDVRAAERAMSMPSLELARRLVDIHTDRASLVSLFSACTPAKLVEVVGHLNVVEMMMAMQKMRARRTPANQAHVTNWKEHPALMAADAAEAALRGFDELETTVRVAPMAPLNALAILIGSQTPRGGVLTQCAVEEALNLRLGLKGLTSYAETLSVYGTDLAFKDGDDTPWSKGLLASAYASRGIKIRFTSGTGSETLMGHEEGRSMLYLEARCLLLVKGAGAQGVQNGSVSCIALPMALPGGARAVLAENLIASVLGLECASGNDAMASHSSMRKTAKLMLQFLPGTDFITSGYSAIPKKDNMFGGGNFDADDLDDWLVIQRDMQVDAGLVPVREEEVTSARREAARAVQAVFREFGFPEITDDEVEAATYAYSSEDVPDRDMVADIRAAGEFLDGPLTVVDVIRALDRKGFPTVASNILGMQRARVTGDYLQPAAILTKDFEVSSAFTDPNDYRGPGTGYRLNGENWRRIADIPQAKSAAEMVPLSSGAPGVTLTKIRDAVRGDDVGEVVIAVGPAFAEGLDRTLGGLSHGKVLAALLDGVRSEGLRPKLIKIHHTADCGALGYEGAKLSGSGIAIGIQSKGTTVIHRHGLAPLNNLELFPQAPSLTLESYRVIGRNAARHAQQKIPAPVPVQVDNMARLRLIVNATLMHRREIAHIKERAKPTELEARFHD
jgi:propanediol dehydratase large subunit